MAIPAVKSESSDGRSPLLVAAACWQYCGGIGESCFCIPVATPSLFMNFMPEPTDPAATPVIQMGVVGEVPDQATESSVYRNYPVQVLRRRE